MGRVGSNVGAMTGGAMLAAHWLQPRIFEAVAMPIAIAAVSGCVLAASGAGRASGSSVRRISR